MSVSFQTAFADFVSPQTGDGAEIIALHTLPKNWGTGFGAAMLTAALNRIGAHQRV